ncbi:OsmC family protein [Acuticoccus sp.]|uniref:OsmC family protein n=1 Tax=Acuticoccus sp. TaxID=1904378 RepID=UPI003B52888C
MKRTASAAWQGALKDGSGTVSTEMGGLSQTPYSFNTRFEDGTSGTNPEELLGAAHAACFTMAVSHELAGAGHPPQRAETKASVQLDQVEGGFAISKIHLSLVADVPGLSDEEFQKIASSAKENCPLSKAIAAPIELDARLMS